MKEKSKPVQWKKESQPQLSESEIYTTVEQKNESQSQPQSSEREVSITVKRKKSLLQLSEMKSTLQPSGREQSLHYTQVEETSLNYSRVEETSLSL